MTECSWFAPAAGQLRSVALGMKLAPLPSAAAAAAAALPPVEIAAPELDAPRAAQQPEPEPGPEPEPEPGPAGFLEVHSILKATDGVFGAPDCFALCIDGARFLPPELAVTNV